MNIEQTLIDQAKQTNLVGIAERYTTLRKEAAREYAGPCPKCGGRDRFHVKPDAWFCRQCHPEFGDQIEFIRWADGADFVTAIERLTGQKPMQPTAQRKPTAIQSPIRRPADWPAKATAIVQRARAKLIDGAGADYLVGRGLQPATWAAFGLGYTDEAEGVAQAFQVPAIVIPWMRGGEISAIHYRFLQSVITTDEDGRLYSHKMRSYPGSVNQGLLYGGQALLGCAEGLRTLVLCEGELNAISIWQVAHPWHFDVLSLGSETAKLTPAMLDYAGRFERVLVWMDKAAVAKSIMALIPGSYGISSPVQDGRKCDANDMLQSGILGGFLATARARACQGETERQRLLWNIDDAVRDGHMDVGACQVAAEMAKGLGVQL